MSETVIIALITFFAGFIGSIIGALSTYKASVLNAKAEQGRLLHNEKKSAYTDVVSAYLCVVENVADIEVGVQREENQSLIDAMSRFFSAYSTAILIAPNDIKSAMQQAGDSLSSMVNSHQVTRNSETFERLTELMRDDLYSFIHEADKKRRFRVQM